MGFAALCAACKPAPPHEPRVAPATLAPASAELVVFAASPAALRTDAAGALANALCARWPAARLHPCEASRWPAAGIDASQPAIAFIDQSRPALIAPIAQQARHEQWLKESGAQPLGASADLWLIPGDAASAALLVASDRGHLLVTDAADLPAAQQAMRRWLTLDDAERWEHHPEQRALARALAKEHAIFAVAQISRWIDALPALSPQAVLLRDLLSMRGGLMGLGVKNAPSRGPGALAITLLHREDAREPAALDALGQAAEPLAPPASILTADTPLAVHMAFEPAQLWRLWRSTLPPQERKQLDDLIESLREDFMLDMERALIHNAQGHVLITLCGLQPGALDAAPLELARGIATLKSTQELIVIPLHDGQRMSQALDIFTTLSRGALRRQTSGGQVQYALFDDGVLSWVFMVIQDDLIIADSAPAFALARAYARRSALAPPALMAEALSSTAGLGLAIQLAPLRALWPDLPRWLDDTASITAHTIPSDDPLTDHLQIIIRSRAALDIAPIVRESP